MSVNTIIITAQIFENYSETDSPSWKPKGQQIFSLQAECDDFFYGEDTCIKAVKNLLKRHSNGLFRYEYLNHEIMFSEPIILEKSDFDAEVEAELAKEKELGLF